MKHFIVSLSVFAILSIILWSCVDVNQPNISTKDFRDFRSLVRFTHVASNSSAAGPITVADTGQVGTIGFLQSTPYLDLRAGGHTLRFAQSSGDLTFITDRQATVFLYPIGDTGVGFLLSNEGDDFKTYAVPDTPQVKLVDLATNFAPAVDFFYDSTDGDKIGAGLNYASDNPYIAVSSGSHQIVAVSSGGYTVALSGQNENPPVSTPDTGSGTMTLSLDNGFEYSFTTMTNNLVGIGDAFFTGADFSLASNPGTSIASIDVSSQSIGFASADLSGDNEVPPETTQASGRISAMSLTADSGRTEYTFTYSITVARDANDTTTSSDFVAAHFHQGAPGTNGPVVKTIATLFTISDTTIEGTWSTSDAVEPLTPALAQDLLDGLIYVNFHTTRHPGGEIRAQIKPDTTTVTSLDGAWSDIPRTTMDSIVAGSMLVNFKTTLHPSGLISGPVKLDPAKGHFGVGSLDSAETFDPGQVYTVVAYNIGNTIHLLKLTNRQGGVAKLPASTAVEPNASRKSNTGIH